MNKIAFISCLFGKNVNRNLYPPPLENQSYFFSNNLSLEKTCISKGWIYIYIDMQLSEDDIISSLQSKYIKFLQFLNDNRLSKLFEGYSYLLYADHKRYVKKTHIESYLKLSMDSGKTMIISKHEEKNILSKEIENSVLQERYKKKMQITLDMVAEKNIPMNTEMCNTGIIFYHLDTFFLIKDLLSNVYNTSILLLQPQCQIIFSIFSKEYDIYILKIPFDFIRIEWKNPDQYFEYNEKKTDHIYLFFIALILLLMFFLYKRRN